MSTTVNSGHSLQGATAESDYQLSPLLAEALAAFYYDLPQLLQEHPLAWVAYHGKQRIAMKDSQFDLYEDCTHRGYKAEDLLFRCVVSEPTEVELADIQER